MTPGLACGSSPVSRRTCASDHKHIIRRKIGRPSRAWSLREGAIMADIPAKMCQRYKHLERIRDKSAMPLVAQTLCSIDQLRERSLFDPDKKRVIARFDHPTTFE